MHEVLKVMKTVITQSKDNPASLKDMKVVYVVK